MLIKRYLFLFSFVGIFLCNTLCSIQAHALESATTLTDRSTILQDVGGVVKGFDVDAGLQSIKSNIYKETLDNGLTLIFYHQKHTPEVMLKVMYDVGSKDEESSEYGFAHLVEHMIFKGTQKLSEEDIFEITRKFGADANADTSYDRTCYFFYTDNKNWKIFLSILADCMQNVRISDEHLASEMKTVFDELKWSNSDGVGNPLTELLPSNHPYHHPIIGYKETILNVDAEKVRLFYKKYYHPHRATVLVVGDLDRNEVVQEVKTTFGAIPGQENPQNTKKEVCATQKDFFQKNIVVYKSQPKTAVSCVWAIPGSRNIKNALNGAILGKYLSDRLRDILQDEKMFVFEVGANPEILPMAGFFVVSFVPQQQKSFLYWGRKTIEEVIELCKKSVAEEIETIQKNGISQDELIRLQRAKKVEFLQAFENCQGCADMIEDFYGLNKNEYEIFNVLALLETITNDDLKTFCANYLRQTLMHTITIKPLIDTEKPAWLDLQRNTDDYENSLLSLTTRSIELEKPATAYALPNPTLLDVVFEQPDREFDLSTGLHVVLKQRSDVPFIVAQLGRKNEEVVDRYFNEKGYGYIPYWATDLLLEGSIGFSKQDHRAFFEGKGASCGGTDFTCLASDFDVVAQRFVHILTKPTYPQKVLDKQIKDSLKALEDSLGNEHFVAYDVLLKHLAQDDILSKKTVQENMADLKKYKRSDLIDFHKKYITPNNMVLTVVGDFDEATIKQQLETAFASWKISSQSCDVEKIAATVPALHNPVPIEQKIYMPKERAILTAGRVMVKVDDPDNTPLRFLDAHVNKVLFDIRERHGLFYGCCCVGLASDRDRQQGLAIISAELSLANVDAVVTLIKSALNNIADKGIPQEDFEFIRNSLINGQAKAYCTNSKVAYALGSTKKKGRPWDYEKKRFEELMAVSRDQLNDVAKKYLNANDWSFVLVGRFEENDRKDNAS